MGNKWKERITKDNVVREGTNTLFVAAGLVGATVIDRLVEKGVEKFIPSAVPYVNYIKPAVTILTGIGVAVMAEPGDAHRKLIGYGVGSAGFLSAARLIPAVDQLMSGVPLGTVVQRFLEPVSTNLTRTLNTGSQQAQVVVQPANSYVPVLRDLDTEQQAEENPEVRVEPRIEPSSESEDELTEELGMVEVI